MIGTVAATAARWRLELVVALAGIASLVVAASFAPTMSAQSVVVLAALSAATSMIGLHRLLVMPDASLRSLRPPRRATDVPLVLAGRSTDVRRHPVRPRAPGLV